MPEPPGGRDEQAVRRFVEHTARVFSDWGFPRMPSRVLLTMMSADEDSLTAADLGERLGVSAAAISGAVRYLMHIGIVTREPVPGSRRDRYRLPDDAWYEASVTKREVLKTIAERAGEGVVALGGQDTPSGARVERMREFFLFVDEELDDMLERWKAAKAREDATTRAS